MPTVLIIDDEPSIAQSLEFTLQNEGFETVWHALAGEGLECLQQRTISLVILDIGLPDMSGFDACKRIRSFSDVPILFLSARSDEIDRIVGLEIGGDDYVTKPFSPREVASRVKAILKRTEFSPAQPLANTKQSIGDFVIDELEYSVCFREQGLAMTKAEFIIFSTLLLRVGQVFSRAQLLDKLQTPSHQAYERTVDSHIKSLRAKLREVGAPEMCIETVRGFGYRIGATS